MGGNNQRKWGNNPGAVESALQQWTSDPSEPIQVANVVTRYPFNNSPTNLRNTVTGTNATATGSITFANSTIHSGYGQAAVFASNITENAPTANYIRHNTTYSSAAYTRLVGNILFTVPTLADPSGVNSYFICGKARNGTPNAMRWQLEFETGTTTYRGIKLRVLDNSGVEIVAPVVDNTIHPIDTANPAIYNVAWEISYAAGNVTATVYVRSDYFDTIETATATAAGVSPFSSDLSTYPFFIGGASFDPGYSTDSFIGTIDYLDIRNGSGNTYPTDIVYMPFTNTVLAKITNTDGFQIDRGGNLTSVLSAIALQDAYDNSTVGSKLITADFPVEGAITLKNSNTTGNPLIVKNSSNNTLLSIATDASSQNVLSVASYGTTAMIGIHSTTTSGDATCYPLQLTNSALVAMPHMVLDGTGASVGSGDPLSGLVAGALWYNGSSNILKYYNGTSTISLVAAPATPTLQQVYDAGNDIALTTTNPINITNSGPAITGTIFNLDSVFTVSNTGKVRAGTTTPTIIDENLITTLIAGSGISIYGVDYLAAATGTYTTNSMLFRSGGIEGVASDTVNATTGAITLQSGAITNVGGDSNGTHTTGDVTLKSGNSTESLNSTTVTGSLTIATGSIVSANAGGTTATTGGITISTGGFSGSGLGTTRNSGTIALSTANTQDAAGNITLTTGTGSTNGNITLTSSGTISLVGTTIVDGSTYPGSGGAATGKAIVCGSTPTNLQFSYPRGTKGADVTAANNLAIIYDGDAFVVTGNTQINLIDTTYMTAGERIFLIFSGTPTVKHNQAPSGANKAILLAGSVDLVAAANTVLQLLWDGTSWQEVSRKVA